MQGVNFLEFLLVFSTIVGMNALLYVIVKRYFNRKAKQRVVKLAALAETKGFKVTESRIKPALEFIDTLHEIDLYKKYHIIQGSYYFDLTNQTTGFNIKLSYFGAYNNWKSFRGGVLSHVAVIIEKSKAKSFKELLLVDGIKTKKVDVGNKVVFHSVASANKVSHKEIINKLYDLSK